jgi:hypothetical protein
MDMCYDFGFDFFLLTDPILLLEIRSTCVPKIMGIAMNFSILEKEQNS